MHEALYALQSDKIDMSMVDMLIKMGADVDKPNYSRTTAFMQAARVAEKRGTGHFDAFTASDTYELVESIC